MLRNCLGTRLGHLCWFLVASTATACQKQPTHQGAAAPGPSDASAASAAAAAAAIDATLAGKTVLAGFRSSRYGVKPFPAADYWQSMAETMAGQYPQGQPGGVWIVGVLHENGCQLGFPAPTVEVSPGISFATEDLNEAALGQFDSNGVKVWLQVEPGFSKVPELIKLVMDRYGHHPSVIGFGVDVEWNQSTNPSDGVAVGDQEAASWLAQVRAYNQAHTLMLKHWLTEKMPPTLRDGLFFLDDSQMFERKQDMVDEFIVWGQTFAPAPVGFQIGYPADEKWWGKLEDPTRDLGRELAGVIPNTTGIFWVDFSVTQVFPLP